MAKPPRQGPARGLGATVTEHPVDGGTFMEYDCTPEATLDPARVHRLVSVELPDARGPAFAAGFWYAADDTTPFGDVATLPFPYYTYRKVKWRTRLQNGNIYHAAAHLKFPLLAAYCGATERWHGLLFRPFVAWGGATLPVYCTVITRNGSRHLRVGLWPGAEVHVDRHAWFGLGTRTHRAARALAPGTHVKFAAVELEALGWPELLTLACRAPLLPQPVPSPMAPDPRLPNGMDRAWRWLARAEDAEHGALIHLLRRGVPGQVSEEFKHSHVTPELHALRLATELEKDGTGAGAPRVRHWAGWALPGPRRVDQGDTCRWQTTTRLTAHGLTGFTHHGAGFVGFPGGQATNGRHLAETYQATGDDMIADAALATARWVVRAQRDDGAWPLVVPVPGEVHVKRLKDGSTACVAATAESVRALLAAYVIDSDRAWLDAADRGLTYVNRAASFFAARGYLRDAAPEEPDGMTAECAIHANLDRARLGPPDAYLAAAQQWAWYGVQWTRPHAADERGAWVVDGLGHTITPRVDVWSALLLGGAWARLGAATDDPFWTRLAWTQLQACLALQERDGGFAETWWYDWPDGLCPVPIESMFLVPAFLDLARRFAPAWRPPAPLQVGAPEIPVHGALPGPAGLTFAFAEVEYVPRMAGLRNALLRSARRSGPRSVPARALGLLQLLTGGEAEMRRRAARPMQHYRVHHGHAEATDTTWRVPFVIEPIESIPPTPTITIPYVTVSGAATVATDAERLLVRAHDGTRWRVQVNADGNVLAEPDGVFSLAFAANWPGTVRPFAGDIACTRQDDHA